MLKVSIDKIIPVTDARANISKLVDGVTLNGDVYVLTRGGRPAVVMAPVEYIEKLSHEGIQTDSSPKIKVTESHAPVQPQVPEVLPQSETEPVVYEEPQSEPVAYNAPNVAMANQNNNLDSDEQPIPINVSKGVWQ